MHYQGVTFEGTTKMILTVEQKVGLNVSILTAAGNPATIDGDVIWESSNNDVARVEVDPENSQIATVFSGIPGVAQISARCDADLDEDEVREIFGNLDVTVIGAEATVIQIIAGEPELK